MSAGRNIVWIASYPKSGNTWVRFVACNLLFGRQDTAQSLNSLAPDIHETGADKIAAHSGLVKTHFLYSAAMPMASRTAAAIYVVRQPADVIVSNFHYAHRSTGAGVASRSEFDRYVDTFIQCRGDPRWAQHGMGGWEEHVRSWLGVRHPFPVLCIRYEDLSASPMKTCGALAKLLRPGSSQMEIEQAVANASFDRMRELEAADIRERRVGIFYKPYLQAAIDAGRRFMRSGAVGDGSRLLAPDQQARLTAAFERILAELGYSGVQSGPP